MKQMSPDMKHIILSFTSQLIQFKVMTMFLTVNVHKGAISLFSTKINFRYVFKMFASGKNAVFLPG